MPLRIKKPVARFLSNEVSQRIKLLESALLEIHDLDNRMKMELLALNTLASPNDEFCEVDCTTFVSAEDEFRRRHVQADNSNSSVKYELVDLNDAVADYEASIDKIDKEIQSIDFHQSQSYFPKSHDNHSSQSSLSPEQLRISKEFSTNNELKYRQHNNTSLNNDNINDVDRNSDSDSSLLAYDINVLKFSSNNNHIRQIECLEDYSYHNNLSTCNRFMEHVYIREEDDDDDDDNTEDSDYVNSNIPMTKYTHDYNLHRLIEVFSRHRILFTCVVCIIPLVICAYTISSSFTSYFSMPEQSLSSKHKIYELTSQLSQEFQGQHKRLWMQIRSVLESSFQHEFTNHQRYTTNERIPPVVFLLVNRIQSVVNNESRYSTSNNNTNVSFHYFISRLGQLLNSLYLSNSKNACSTIESSQLNSSNKQKINQMKLTFDRQLDELYNSGARCFHFTSIDLLPANVVLLFHGYADVENSVYPNSILLISLSKRFEVSESFNCTMKKSEYILPGCKTPGQFEHQVNLFLRSLWNKYLGNEEVDALISRLTTNIIVFHT
ncbi:hypothetical protein MN116_004498 [Schistosoma mekongi]|uniref:Uncharacterized protein n=1 Tax=Schistosoma mekongi TaxID=38744 RepID=A0AAE2D6U3_SCHME|nr:hypothetical protein MN116_004498 [Schistosoma mekongi]